MKILSIQPHALLDMGNIYKIMRYNVQIRDWEVLDNIFTQKQEAQDFINQLNEDSGLVPYIIDE